MDKLHQTLMRYFGYSAFKVGQEDIIQSVLHQKDTVAMLPTGGGKSLCYQIPGYMTEGLVLIISPLLSLMEDQVERMKMRGEKRVAALNSTLSFHERRHIIRHLPSYKFLFVAPEALMSDALLQQLKSMHVGLFVVDEAHCISEWGHDFRPEYSKLGEWREALGHPIALALTATATKQTLKDTVQTLRLQQPDFHIHSVNRPNIALVKEVHETKETKEKRALELVETIQGPGLIYCPTRQMTEDIALLVKQKTHQRVEFYHGGMEAGDRMLIQQQFISGQIDLICCTSAFGMGIDKADIRFVIHMSPPQSIEAFMQEIGRAGRDGKSSVSVLLYTEEDADIQSHLIQAEGFDDPEIDFFLAQLSQVPTNDEKKLRERLMEAGLQETRARMLTHYYMMHQSEQPRVLLENLKEKLQDRQTEKLKKVWQFKERITDHSCFRQSLLSYFDEQLDQAEESSSGNCCSSCGLDLSDYEKKDQPLELNEMKHWKTELERMFHLTKEAQH
ncbi:RecQ family ATP-dependent DNA helicase [Bacillus xiamenensis]|uniref:RecQ family ATP-dependent DNA helicase n=1 Tax=Bacillus xiamenensis TaxID=1178537 RepID=UPI00028DC002|nr:ATP-dependent DNA helicase RecQ [Bacillus xiamenensis]EKF34121.1 ATP-dependent helicase RecQ [Bacillus xiamenensis]